MARPRRPKPESSYEKRIRRYLEQHPGATRQQARGHRPPKGRSEYAVRVERYLARNPRATRAEAAGHRSGADLERALRSADPQTRVAFNGLDRQPDGSWRRASFVLFAPDEPEREFIVGPSRAQLRRLPRIAAIIDDRGLQTLGADYLQKMVEWVKDEL